MARGLVDTTYVEAGVPGLRIAGDRVALTLIPDAGGKLLDLVHVPTGVGLLWRNPRVPLRPTYAGAAFDDVWCGGWDELFPTDPPCVLDGNAYHDHGDLWFGPWTWEVEADDGREAVVRLERDAVALPCRMTKRIVVRRDEPAIHVRYRLENLSSRPVPYCWSLHVAHPIGPGSRVHLDASAVRVVAESPGRFADAGEELAWPVHDGLDLAALPGPAAGLTEWLRSAEPAAGWCAVAHRPHGVGLGLAFDRAVLPTTWLWGVYGGWRGHHVLLTEPSTSPPGGLAASVLAGTAAWLAGDATLETEVVATVLEGVPADLPGDVAPPGLVLPG